MDVSVGQIDNDSESFAESRSPPSSFQHDKRVPQTSSARTTGDKVSGKKKRVSKSATMQAEYDEKLRSIENNFNEKFDKLFEMFGNVQNRDSLLRSERQNLDNVPRGEHRPILSLDANLDQDLGSPRVSRNRDLDERSEISLHVNHNERNEFDIRSEVESISDTGDSPVRVSNYTDLNTNNLDNRKCERFVKHIESNSNTVNVVSQDKSVEGQKSSETKQVDVLSKIFKEDIQRQKSSVGLVLDQSQVNILDSSWRSKNPDRISAFRDEYKNCFPLQDSAPDYLQVPTLDDLLEPMLRQTHGEKAVKSWDKHRQLFTQPLKQVERLGFQGQLSSRMNIISVLYIQQALGSLLQKLEADDFDREQVCQTIKDVFAMTTKTLDQSGRSGAFFHLIRRKAAAQDSGLTTLKDMRSKCQYLPLTSEGVFGKGLEDCLEKRKEQKDQLSDLLPEFSRKRKFENDNRDKGNNKVPRYTNEQSGRSFVNRSSSTTSNSTGSFSNYRKSTPYQKDKNKDSNNNNSYKKDSKTGGGKSATQSSWGSFRVPKKRDS